MISFSLFFFSIPLCTAYPDAKLVNKDIREYFPKITFDYIVGNPPYGLEWKDHQKDYSSELYYCIKAHELLKPGGILAIIVPDSFCSDEFSDKSKIEELNSAFNYVVQISLDKNSFKHVGVENYNLKLLILQKKSVHIQDRIFKNEILNISDADLIYKEFIKSLIEEKDKLKQKLFLENIKNDNSEFQFKVKKLVCDIKANPKIKKYLAECLECINQYRNQKQPSYMNYDEWQKIKITKSDVLRKLKDTLRLQNPRNSKQNRLIKDKYNLRLNDLKIPIYKAVTDNYYPFENTKYKKLERVHIKRASKIKAKVTTEK